jgi:hypothetical protein
MREAFFLDKDVQNFGGRPIKLAIADLRLQIERGD